MPRFLREPQRWHFGRSHPAAVFWWERLRYLRGGRCGTILRGGTKVPQKGSSRRYGGKRWDTSEKTVPAVWQLKAEVTWRRWRCCFGRKPGSTSGRGEQKALVGSTGRPRRRQRQHFSEKCWGSRRGQARVRQEMLCYLRNGTAGGFTETLSCFRAGSVSVLAVDTEVTLEEAMGTLWRETLRYLRGGCGCVRS